MIQKFRLCTVLYTLPLCGIFLVYVHIILSVSVHWFCTLLFISHAYKCSEQFLQGWQIHPQNRDVSSHFTFVWNWQLFVVTDISSCYEHCTNMDLRFGLTDTKLSYWLKVYIKFMFRWMWVFFILVFQLVIFYARITY